MIIHFLFCYLSAVSLKAYVKIYTCIYVYSFSFPARLAFQSTAFNLSLSVSTPSAFLTVDFQF